MKITRLITYSFSPNVGPLDRIFRMLSGLAIAVLPWTVLTVTTGLAILLTVFGIAWLLTGVVSRCGLYYTFGLSTLKNRS